MSDPTSRAPTSHAPALEDTPLRVVVRPLANPLPLGFLALAVATVSLALLQVGALADDQGHTIAIVVLAFTVPLQLVASVLGFLSRDAVAGTGMGVLAGTWAVTGFVMLGAPPGSTSPALGVLLLGSAVALLVPTVAATGKLAGMAVMGLSALRFAITGIGQLTDSARWLTLAGWVGLFLGVVAAYAALAFELEDVRHASVLPVGRRGQGADTMTAGLEEAVAAVPREAGVRKQL